ncbi:unnamed protein product [Paramecium pentaurelia]|uniref:Secreted protein n=1 Tax=Paramecium pentaurelia TaxID=43138 RepID=A0A8S1XKA3_9CILI|nr:unnamed protein product [Paramecium pentaurelia]
MFQQYKLISFALIIQSVFAVQKDTQTILTEFDADNFRNTILSTVRMYLQLKENAEEILVLLNQVLAGLVDDQINMIILLELTEQHALLLLQNQKILLLIIQEDNEKALAETETDARQIIQLIIIQYNKKDVKCNDRTFAQEDTKKNKAHKFWVRKNGENDDAIVVVDETTNQLVQYLSMDATFAELKQKFEALQMRLIENESHGALIQPIVTAQTGLATKVDQKAILRILQLLSQLRQQLIGAGSNFEDTEIRQGQRWVEFSTYLTYELNILVDRKNQLEQAIQTFKANIDIASFL